VDADQGEVVPLAADVRPGIAAGLVVTV